MILIHVLVVGGVESSSNNVLLNDDSTIDCTKNQPNIALEANWATLCPDMSSDADL